MITRKCSVMREKDVLDLVIEYERKKGRTAKQVRRRGEGYDLESNGRLIEVKRRNFPKERFILLTQNEMMNFIHNPNSWLYVVYNDGDWHVIELDRDKVLKGVQRIITQFQVSLRKEIVGI
ncbi:hypothetical protein HRbin04_00987 [archaeon HR04]|nr:hypothetical protein HRbin04_00987 [archaeon HR04]